PNLLFSSQNFYIFLNVTGNKRSCQWGAGKMIEAVKDKPFFNLYFQKLTIGKSCSLLNASCPLVYLSLFTE
ncbi:MAG: hypothetical protein L0J35_02105, partial [Tetragenococcus halophilus]|nr:hypothetical protein [Tetragenococcus halophilus]